MRTKIGNRVSGFDDIAEKALGHLLEQSYRNAKKRSHLVMHILFHQCTFTIRPISVSISVVGRFSFNSKRDCCPENYRPVCNFLDAIAFVRAVDNLPVN